VQLIQQIHKRISSGSEALPPIWPRKSHHVTFKLPHPETLSERRDAGGDVRGQETLFVCLFFLFSYVFFVRVRMYVKTNIHEKKIIIIVIIIIKKHTSKTLYFDIRFKSFRKTLYHFLNVL
jgi:hypothetical protein